MRARFTFRYCLTVFFISFCAVSYGKTHKTVFTGNEYSQSTSVFVDKTVEDFPNINEVSPSDFQLVSHGRPGELLLNGQWLDAPQIASFLTSHISALTSHINIYGCEFGKGEKGRAAVVYLQKRLGLAVSASDDITGKDGDWDLEVGTYVFLKGFGNYQGNLQCTYGPYTINPTVSWVSNGNLDSYTDISENTPNNTGGKLYSDGANVVYSTPAGFQAGDVITIRGNYQGDSRTGPLVLTSVGSAVLNSGSIMNNAFPANAWGDVTYTIPAGTATFSQLNITGATQNGVYVNIDVVSITRSGCYTCDINIAPVLSSATVSNVCPVITYNLNSITASNTPVGAELTWHTGTPATTANKISNPAGIDGNTFYAAFHSIANDCYSGIGGIATTKVTASGDRDCDGTPDAMDLDDDNDGVPDFTEMFLTISNSDKTGVTVTKPATINYSFNSPNTLANLVDGVSASAYVISNPTGTLNGEWFRVEFATPRILMEWELANYPGSSMFTTSSTYRVEGSNDATTWTNLTGTLTYTSNQAGQGSAGAYSNIAKFTSNTTAYKYYRYVGISAAAGGGYITEFFFKEKSYADKDTDNDGIVNRFDLDSDGDGCSDAFESGATTNTIASYQFPDVDANNDGLVTAVDAGNDGTVDYISTYHGYAELKTVESCKDSDGDGILDISDIDDDNDGVPDASEQNAPPCSTSNCSSWVDVPTTASTSAPRTIIVDGEEVSYTVTTNYTLVDAGTTNWTTLQCGLGTITGLVAWHQVTGANQTTTFNFSKPVTNFQFILSAIEAPEAVQIVTNNSTGQQKVCESCNKASISAANMQTLDVAGTGSAAEIFRVSGPVYTQISVRTSVVPASYYLAFGLCALKTYTEPATDIDTDGDGIPNRLDLDSDGDGCSDLKEAAVSPATDIITPSSTTNNAGGSYGIAAAKLGGSQLNPAAADINNDGLNDSVDPTGTDGNPDYSSTYFPVALSAIINACTDADGDGTGDISDIDVDNDGIINSIESPSCFVAATDLKSVAYVSTDVTFNNLNLALDGDNTTFGDIDGGYIANKTLIEFDLPLTNPISISTITVQVGINNAFGSSSFQMQGWTGNTWEGLSATQPMATASTTYTFTNTLFPSKKYNKFRIRGLTGTITNGTRIHEVNLTFAQTPITSLEPSATCTSDIDGDGIFNYLDLDSDGDGCSDLSEAGVSPTGDVITPASTTNSAGNSYGIAANKLTNSQLNSGGVDANNDGLNDSVDPDLNGITNYYSTYSPFAIGANYAACQDTDGDGVNDVVDIDDDNDGVLDAVESPSCFYTLAEAQNLTTTTPLTDFVWLSNSFPNAYDGDASVAGTINPAVTNINGLSLIDFVNPLQRPMLVSNVQVLSGSARVSDVGALWRLEGWNGTSWVALSATQAMATANTTYTFNYTVAPLNVKYTRYRIAGTTSTVGVPANARVAEVYINYSSYASSANPKLTCTADKDNDGILNHLDLDSDGDGCPDAKEAGVNTQSGVTTSSGSVKNGSGSTVTSTVATAGAVINGPYSGNGFADTLQSTADTNAYKYSYNFYYYYALKSGKNMCLDTDGDSIPDLVDIDDDNDGITDIEESGCNADVGYNTNVASGIDNAFLQYGVTSPVYTQLADDMGLIFAESPAFSSGISLNSGNCNVPGLQGTSFSADIWIKSVNPSNIAQAVPLYSISLKNDCYTSTPEYLTYSAYDSNSNLLYTYNIAADPSITQSGNYKFDLVMNPAYDVYQIKITRNANAAIVVGAKLGEGNTAVLCDMSLNTDGDSVPNYLDLDSDNDGCPDAYEARVTSNPGTTGAMSSSGGVSYNGGTLYNGGIITGTANAYVGNGNPAQYGANGFYNNIEMGTESGVYSGSGGYFYNYAISSFINRCNDHDGDGIDDVNDIDDDNDGVVDATESPNCYYTANEWNTNAIPDYTVAITSSLTTTVSHFDQLVDTIENVTAVTFSATPVQSISNANVYLFTFVNPIRLSALYLEFNTATQFAGTTKIQGSNTNNGIDWVNLSVDIPQTAGANVTANGSVSIPNSIKYPVTSNASTAYKYIRITGGATASNILAQNAAEIYFDVNTVYYIPSLYPKESCSNDTDGDGTINQWDLNSDNDDCSDALEAGATTVKSAIFQFSNHDFNGDGLVDSVDADGDEFVNYISTYNPYAVSALISACTDTDNDGIADLIDIDDDNDGILDAVESPACFYSATEVKTLATVTSGFTYSVAPNALSAIYDNATTTFGQIPTATNILGKALYTLVLPTISAQKIVSITDSVGATAFGTGTWILQGSIDGTTWDTLSAAQAMNTANTKYTFSNTLKPNNAYYQYRLVGATSTNTTANAKLQEININYTNYSASSNPKLTCVNDMDGDGIPNHRDLDSDGDKCPDAYEAGTYNKAGVTTSVGNVQNGSGGAVTSTMPTANAIINGSYSGNGFADVLQTLLPGDTNTYRYSYTYSVATDSTQKACCLASTTAPVLSKTIDSVCSNSTYDLNTLATSTAPAYNALTWFTDNTHTTAVATPSAATTGTYYAFYKDTINNCYSPASVAFTLTAKSMSVGSASPQTICSGATSSVALSSTFGSTAYIWTAAVQSGMVTGFSNCTTGCGSSIAQTLTGAGVVRYTVTPSANGCSGNSFTVDVTVVPIPTATIAYSGSPYSSGSGTANVTQTGQTGGTYSVTPSGLNINTSTGQVNVNNSFANTYTVKYVFSNGTCTDSTTTVFKINPTNDTVTTMPGCPTCPTTVCAVVDDVDTTGGATYSTPCGTPAGYTVGTVSASGCLTFTPNGSINDTATACIVTCHNGMCDTTRVILYPPTPTADTVTTQSGCPTCPTTVCPVFDDVNSSATLTITTCGTPSGYIVSGPDANHCFTYTPNGNVTDTSETCIVVCDGTRCDTTRVVLYPPIVSDTIIVQPSCPTCPVVACAIVDDIPVNGNTTYSSCGLDPAHAGMGNYVIDLNGCLIWQGNGGQNPNNQGSTDTIKTCIVACNGTVCDTTYVYIIPASPPYGPDTVMVPTQAAGTSTAALCATGDDVPSGYTNVTQTNCGLSGAATSQGTLTTNASGCLIWTPNTTQTDTVKTCIVKNADTVIGGTTYTIHDTTFVYYLPPPQTDTQYIQAACPGCDFMICPTADDITVTSGTTFSTCGLPVGYVQTGGYSAAGCITIHPDPNNPPTDTLSTCIVACNGNICDTTRIILYPPTPTADTVTVTPTCPTCPVVVCPVFDDVSSSATLTVTSCGTPAGYTMTGPNPTTHCYTFTPNGTVNDTASTCIVVCDGNRCDTTRVILYPPTPTADTVTVTPTCPTCPITVCAIVDDVDTTGGATYSTPCGTPNGYTASVVGTSGCITYTPTGTVTDTSTACIVTCANGRCDTTRIILYPPTPTADTVTTTPTCPTCPVVVCPVFDDVSSSATLTVTSCGTPAGYTMTGPNPTTHCYTFTPNGAVNDTSSTCIVVCDGNRCDTTRVIIYPPVPTNDTVIVTPTCPTCPITVCAVVDDVDTTGGATYSTPCGTPTGYTASTVGTSGCITYTPTGSVTDTSTACIVTCANGRCDTTRIILYPPTPTADTVTVTPTCPTCPVVVCPVFDDVSSSATLTATSCGTPAGYTMTGPNPTTHCYTFTPNGTVNDTSSTCIVVCDGNRCDTTRVIIYPPVPTNDTVIITPTCPTCLVVVCPVFDDVSSSATLTVTSCGTPAGYTMTGPNPTTHCYTFTPNGTVNDTSSTCIVVCDGNRCDTTRVILYPPVPTSDTVIVIPTCPTCPITVCAVVDDVDTTGGATYSTPCGTPAGYTASTVGTSGCITYTPTGSVTDTSTACIVTCANGRCDTTRIILYPPAPTADTVTVTPNCPTCPVVVCPVFDDVSSSATLTVTSCGTPAGYTMTGPNPTTHCYTFTPNGTATDTVEGCIVVCDGTRCDTTRVIIYPPAQIINHDWNVGFTNMPVTGNVSSNDQVYTNSTYGNIQGNTNNPTTQVPTLNSNGTYSFTASQPGNYVFTVSVCAPGQTIDCPTQLLTINITDTTPNTNALPIANPDMVTTPYQTAVGIPTLDNDASGNYGGSLNPASVTITKAPNHGTIDSIGANGDIYYTPAPGFTGTDTLVYSVCDQLLSSNCDTAYQVITVLPLNAANTTAASDDYAYTLAGTPTSGNVRNNDIDPEGNTLTVTPATVTNANGTFTVDDQGNYSFTPAANFVGSASYTYQVCDNGTPSACATATVHILVYPANTTPLPIKVIDFTGKALTDHSNQLNWKVTDVKGMDSYEIIRSTDQRVWTSLGRIAAENKDGIQNMQLIDNNPDMDDFYRLVLHGQNGQSETYPKVVHIRRSKDATEWVKLYPNPAETVVNLEYYSLDKDGELEINLMDVTGRKIKSVKQQLTEGSNVISINITGIADGMYNIHYTNTTNGKHDNIKFIKKTK